MTDDTKYKPLTGAQSKLIDASVAIFGEQATKKDAAFIARELVQATLPHKNPGDVPLWKRTNGNLTLKSYGYPYGTIPRLLLFWITTEALRNKTKENPRRLELGRNLKGFMLEIGLNPDNGSRGAKRSDARRLNDQMHRFFNSMISFEGNAERDGRGIRARLNIQVARKIVFWWDTRVAPHLTVVASGQPVSC